MAFEEIRDYFTRHVLGRVKVRNGSAALRLRAPRVRPLRHAVAVHPVRSHTQVRTPQILSFHGQLACSSGGFRVARVLAGVKGGVVQRYARGAVRTHRAPLFVDVGVANGLKRALVLPQERSDRLRWRRPDLRTKPGEVVLAWYGPLIRDAVVKLELNRRRGTLLVWYNPVSRHFSSGNICLCRRMGAGEKPEWRWF